MIGRVLRVVVPVALIVVVGAGLWMAFTGSRALAAVDDLQAAADDVQVAIDDTDVPALRSAAADAQDAALRANDALDGPVWGLVAAIPYVGDTPEVARVTASALATAADGLTPLLEVSDVLDPASLYSDGRIAVDELRAAAEPLALASADLDAAAAEIATAPTAADGAWVPASLDAQRADAADQLTEAADGPRHGRGRRRRAACAAGRGRSASLVRRAADAGRGTGHRWAARQLRRPSRRTTAG